MSINDELFKRAEKVITGGACSPVRSFKSLGMAPIFFKEAKGAYLKSEDGNEYLDFCQAFGVNALGHIDNDVKKEVDKIISSAWTLGTAERFSLELAEFIKEHITFVENIRFTVSGTEATMSAIRLAKAFTKRGLALKFDGCYHGHADSVFEQVTNVRRDIITTPLNSLESFKNIIAERGKEIACLILEPLPANNGLLIQTNEFLHEVVSICKENDILVILDEVITGFRVGMGGMAEKLGITPDLVCYGKIVGGGFPASCYGGRADIMSLIAPSGSVYQAGTFAGHPLSMVAGLETLKKLKRINGFKMIADLGNYLKSEILKIGKYKLSEYSGIFWLHDIEFDNPRSVNDINVKKQMDFFKPMFLKLLEQGIYIAPHAFEANFITTAHTKDNIDKLVKAIHS